MTIDEVQACFDRYREDAAKANAAMDDIGEEAFVNAVRERGCTIKVDWQDWEEEER